MGQIAEARERTAGARTLPSSTALNRKIKDDRRVTMVMLPIGDGLTICRKRG